MTIFFEEDKDSSNGYYGGDVSLNEQLTKSGGKLAKGHKVKQIKFKTIERDF